ncbi:site-specific integrase [Asinibacterium sp. OR53]|uniref:site-specific integrase n=1 Tax=Asinibacterium sp. OR53 TaxID=925409 RepID=UPI0004B43BD0|nr:site-specific integrase [Asinibacterium sp. OR53]
MASIKAVLYTSKTLNNGEHPIMLRVIKDRKSKYLSLHMSCSKELWDNENNLPKKKHPLYKEMLIAIDKKKLAANKLLLELHNDEKDVSAEEIKSKLKTSVVNKKTVFQYFDEVIKRLTVTNRLGYASIFKSTKNSLKTFRNDRDLHFSDITTSFLTKYEDAFYERGVTPNSVFVFLRTFKTLINYARKDGIVKTDFDPFKDINFTKFRRIKTRKRAITKEQIRKIETLKIKDDQGLLNAKNYFLFSYYNRGINFIDMAFLKWENIKNGRLVYSRRKTKEDFTIALLPPAIKILEYYKKYQYEDENSFIFPILSHSYETQQSVRNRLVKMLRIVNHDLKTIADKTGIKEKLTTYVARHSFATNLKRSGISTSVISEAMGHDSEKTTKIYLDSFENTILDEASKSIL